jgi:hypothetical protein
MFIMTNTNKTTTEGFKAIMEKYNEYSLMVIGSFEESTIQQVIKSLGVTKRSQLSLILRAKDEQGIAFANKYNIEYVSYKPNWLKHKNNAQWEMVTDMMANATHIILNESSSTADIIKNEVCDYDAELVDVNELEPVNHVEVAEQPKEESVIMTNTFASIVNEGTVYSNTNKSEKAIKYYYDLCKRNNATPADITGWTAQQLSKAIDEAKAPQASKASPKQIELIQKIMDRNNYPMDKLVAKYGPIANLSGGKEGQASKVIDALLAREKADAVNSPINEEQRLWFEKAFLCPNVNFLELGIIMNPRWDRVEDKWVKVNISPNEYIKAVSKLTREEASSFQRKYQNEYYEFQKGKATDKQVVFIKKLITDINNSVKPCFVEYVTDLYGNVTEVLNGTKEYADKINLTDLDLYYLTQESAKFLIDQLQSERGDSSLRRVVDTDELKKGEKIDTQSEIIPFHKQLDYKETIGDVCLELHRLADTQVEEEFFGVDKALELCNYIVENGLAQAYEVFEIIQDHNELVETLFYRANQ